VNRKAKRKVAILAVYDVVSWRNSNIFYGKTGATKVPANVNRPAKFLIHTIHAMMSMMNKNLYLLVSERRSVRKGYSAYQSNVSLFS
jgi:hypothetical protein